MKGFILSIAFVILGITAVEAQDKDKIQDRDRDQTHWMLVDGDVLQIQDRTQIRLRDKITLSNGTILNSNGTYQTFDRRQLRLQDGECFDMAGNKFRNEYQYRLRVKQENKGLTRAQITERNQNRVHYMLVDGELLQIRNQTQQRIQQQINLGNGIALNPDGAYQSQDRRQLRLLDGQCLNTDGKLFKNQIQFRQHLVRVQNNMRKNKVQKKVTMKKNVGKKSIIKTKKGKKGN